MRPASRQLEILEHPSVSDGGNPQFRAVPRHLGMTPAQPAKSRSVGAQSGRRIEVIPGCDHLSCARIAVEWNGDERVDRLTSFVRVILTHTEQAPPALVYCRVRIEPLALGGKWVSNWIAVGRAFKARPTGD